MFIFYFLFGNYTQLSGNLTQTVSQNASAAISNATQAAEVIQKNSSTILLAQVKDFVVKVAVDNVSSCFNYAQQASLLFFQFEIDAPKCSNVIQTLSTQTFTNISITFTSWIQSIVSWSTCHDGCFTNYCGGGMSRTPSLCWLLKQFMPGRYDTQASIDSYGNCCNQCAGQIQQSSLSINATANITMQSTTNATQVVIQQVQQCVEGNFTAIQLKLNQTIEAYNTCVNSSSSTTVSTSTVSTSTVSTSTVSTLPPGPPPSTLR